MAHFIKKLKQLNRQSVSVHVIDLRNAQQKFGFVDQLFVSNLIRYTIFFLHKAEQ